MSRTNDLLDMLVVENPDPAPFSYHYDGQEYAVPGADEDGNPGSAVYPGEVARHLYSYKRSLVLSPAKAVRQRPLKADDLTPCPFCGKQSKDVASYQEHVKGHVPTPDPVSDPVAKKG